MTPAECAECLRRLQEEVCRLRDRTYDPRGTAEQVAAVARTLTGGGKDGLLLSGGVGNGKTTLARAVQKLVVFCGTDLPEYVHSDYVDRHRDRQGFLQRGCRWATSDDVVKAWVDENGGGASVDERRAAQVLRDAAVLVVDDVGLEPAEVLRYGNPLRPVADLIGHRYDRRLFTVMTTNLDADALEARYGGRVRDRLREMVDLVTFDRGSYR